MKWHTPTLLSSMSSKLQVSYNMKTNKEFFQESAGLILLFAIILWIGILIRGKLDVWDLFFNFIIIASIEWIYIKIRARKKTK